MWFPLQCRPTAGKLIFVSSLIVFVYCAIAHPVPSVNINKTFVNFEKVIKGQTATQHIDIYNKGDDTLGIIDIKTNCSCLKTKIKNKSIYPREKTVLEIQFDSSKKPAGPFHQEIILKTSDPENEFIKITVLGYIEEMRKGLELKPQTLNFGNVAKGNKESREIIVTNHDSKDYMIIELIPGFGISVDQAKNIYVPKKSKILIPVQISSWVKPGLFSSTLTLRTTDPNNPMFQIKVSAKILEPSVKKYNHRLNSGRF